jgi:hypothetical protein
MALSQEYSITMSDQIKKSDLELAIECGVPTKEEFFQSQMSQGKKENNSGWSEDYTESLLKNLDFPSFHRIDDNPIYDAEIKQRNRKKQLAPMLTPDFVVGEQPVEANSPKDFYIDVNEITEGVWGNFNDEKNKFPNGNPIKQMYQELNDNKYTSDKPYRLMLNEGQADIVQSLYTQIKSKSEKYSKKRNDSKRFGLVSVLAKDGFHIAQIHYQKLLISIFDDMLIPFFKGQSTESACEQLRDIKLTLLNPGKKAGFVPIVSPFDGNWCFWIIAGTTAYEGDCLCLINSNVLSTLPQDDPVVAWINKMAKI